MIRDYDYIAHVGAMAFKPAVLEAYAGADIVQWWGNILHQLGDMKIRAEETGNDEYVGLLSRFIRTWQENELNGSVNIEDVRSLKTASEWAGALQWNFSNYFQSLANWLRRLQASIEQLPMTGASPSQGGGGGGGAPGGASPDIEQTMNAQFGPEEEQGDNEQSPEQKLDNEGEDTDDVATDLQNDLDAAVGAARL